MPNFEITRHAVYQFQERVQGMPAPAVQKIIRSHLLEEYRRPSGKKKRRSVARTFENGSYQYFYLPGYLRDGTKFWLSVDEGVNVVYTVLSDEQFNSLSYRSSGAKTGGF